MPKSENKIKQINKSAAIYFWLAPGLALIFLFGFYTSRLSLADWLRSLRQLESLQAIITLLLVILVVITFFNFKNRRESLDKLIESEQRYRDLFDNANDLIWSVDLSGRFVYINRAWKEKFKYNDDEIKKITLMDLVEPKYLDRFLKAFKQVTSGNEVKNIEAAFITKNGDKIVVEGSCGCYFIGGRPFNIRFIFRDMTERNSLEEKLKAHNQELERINRLMIGREQKMLELKNEINQLKQKNEPGSRY
jgi:PAS domain S-box-containing protein